MCNKQRFLKLLVVSITIGGFPGMAAWAHSVPVSSKSVVNSPSRILMIDGKDRNSRVKVKARLDVPEWGAFDFGFMQDSLYTLITDKPKNQGGYVFAGGTVVDFALRNYGADRLFGTTDDLIYRLSDDANYVRETFSKPVKSSKSQNPTLTQEYFRDLRLGWDLDLDGKPDAYAWLKIKGEKYDGMMPATAVPAPAAVWLFGSGLVGLAVATRRAGKARGNFNIAA